MFILPLSTGATKLLFVLVVVPPGAIENGKPPVGPAPALLLLLTRTSIECQPLALGGSVSTCVLPVVSALLLVALKYWMPSISRANPSSTLQPNETSPSASKNSPV